MMGMVYGFESSNSSVVLPPVKSQFLNLPNKCHQPESIQAPKPVGGTLMLATIRNVEKAFGSTFVLGCFRPVCNIPLSFYYLTHTAEEVHSLAQSFHYQQHLE